MRRREWIKGVALTFAAPRFLPRANALAYSANERLRLAVVGVAGYGAWHGFAEALHTLGNVSYSVSCDVDSRKVQKVYDLWQQRAAQWANADDPVQRRAAAEVFGPLAAKKPPLYADFRRMFDEAATQFDAVVVATPDHTHAIIAAAALRAGKPVCSERPLGFNIGDARDLRTLAAETKLPTTYRSPGTGNGHFRRAIELVEDGVIGPVKEVYVWFDRGGPDRDAIPTGSQPVPEGLNWDLWLGPLAWREYHPDWMSYSHWRETCSGGLGVFGMHASIFPFMALGLRELWDTAGALLRYQYRMGWTL